MKGISREPSFLFLWLGQILSQSGAKMYQMAIVWWMVTHVPEKPGIWVGAFMVMTALPAILLLKAITNVIETNSSKRVLVGCDLLAAALVGFVGSSVAEHWLSPGWLLATGFFSALLQGTLDPTLNKSVAEVVAPESVPKAVGLLSTTQSVANFSGAILGAILISVMGIANVCFMAALGYLVSATASSRVHFRFATPVHEIADSKVPFGWNELTPFLKRILIGFSFINFFGTPTLVVLPLYTKLTLQGDTTLLARLEATLWLGILAGSFLSPYVKLPKRAQDTAAISLSAFGFFIFLAGVVPKSIIYQTGLGFSGLCLGINNVVFMTLFQNRVPQAVKARFFTLVQAIISFTFPIAYFLFGVLCDVLSPRSACLIQGVGIAVVAASFYLIAEEDPNALSERLGIPSGAT